MTAIREELDTTLRALPQARALRKAAAREGEQYSTIVDKIACSPFAPSMRVALLLDIAYRSLLAAVSVVDTARVPIPAARAVSLRPGAVDSLLSMGEHWRDRCSGCGRPCGRSHYVNCCAPGKCPPITGWEPRITPGLDGRGEWDA